MQRVLPLLAVALVLFGCKPVERGSDVPMPTTGPRQVVLKLPAMSCADCPISVSAALTTLPWVDSATIQTDGKLRQVKFAVTDLARFDLEEIARALGPRYSYDMKLLAGPTDR